MSLCLSKTGHCLLGHFNWVKRGIVEPHESGMHTVKYLKNDLFSYVVCFLRQNNIFWMCLDTALAKLSHVQHVEEGCCRESSVLTQYHHHNTAHMSTSSPALFYPPICILIAFLWFELAASSSASGSHTHTHQLTPFLKTTSIQTRRCKRGASVEQAV